MAAKSISQAGQPPEGVLAVADQNSFYKEGFQKSLRISMISMVIAGLSLLVAVLAIILQPKPEYFASTQDGRVVPLTPLSEPLMNHDAILLFATTAAQKSFVLDFNNYRGQLQGVRSYYTNAGYKSFMDSLESSGLISKITTKRMVASAVPVEAPIIEKEGVAGGIYYWIVGMPVAIMLQGQSERLPMNVLLRLRIERLPTVDNPRGIGVGQMVAIQR